MRGSGRTYRTLLEAILLASTGKVVYHVSLTPHGRGSAFVQCKKFLPRGTRIVAEDYKIKMPRGGGSIKFLTLIDADHKRNSTDVYKYDHCVEEHISHLLHKEA